MGQHFVFGYGSLVNRATHEFGTAHPAELRGWRRVWRYTTRRDVAFLNAEPAPGHNIRGLMMATPRKDPALQRREYAYEKYPVTEQVAHGLETPVEINVFAIPRDQDQDQPPGNGHVLLLSYIDVVVQGYLQEYGEAGVADFFQNTEGWQSVIIDDRAAPRYPRHRPLSPRTRALSDHWLNQLSAVVKQL